MIAHSYNNSTLRIRSPHESLMLGYTLRSSPSFRILQLLAFSSPTAQTYPQHQECPTIGPTSFNSPRLPSCLCRIVYSTIHRHTPLKDSLKVKRCLQGGKLQQLPWLTNNQPPHGLHDQKPKLRRLRWWLLQQPIARRQP